MLFWEVLRLLSKKKGKIIKIEISLQKSKNDEEMQILLPFALCEFFKIVINRKVGFVFEDAKRVTWLFQCLTN